MSNYDYQFKSYERLLEESLSEEENAGELYDYMANISPDWQTAEVLKGMAADERRHKGLLAQMLAKSEGPWEAPHKEHRSLSVYIDWLVLADEIKEFDKSEETSRKINECLTDIAYQKPSDIESKDWLRQKARTVGIDV